MVRTSTTRSGVSHRRERAKRPQGPPISWLAPSTAGSDTDGVATLTQESCHPWCARQPPGGLVLFGEAAAAALDDWLGEGDGGGECPGGVFVGTTVGVRVRLGVGVGDLLGDGEPDDAEALGDGLIAWPTCAGGGKLSTGLPVNAPFIICCQVSAGRSPP